MCSGTNVVARCRQTCSQRCGRCLIVLSDFLSQCIVIYSLATFHLSFYIMILHKQSVVLQIINIRVQAPLLYNYFHGVLGNQSCPSSPAISKRSVARSSTWDVVVNDYVVCIYFITLSIKFSQFMIFRYQKPKNQLHLTTLTIFICCTNLKDLL